MRHFPDNRQRRQAPLMRDYKCLKEAYQAYEAVKVK